LERYFSGQKDDTTREELGFIQGQISELDIEDDRLYRAYLAGAFEPEEFAEKRHTMKERRTRLEESKAHLLSRLSQQVSKQERIRKILASLEDLRAQATSEIPFEVKRRILVKVVDKVIVNSREKWFELAACRREHPSPWHARSGGAYNSTLVRFCITTIRCSDRWYLGFGT
jgi:chromosome segregation ATPase